ncbi:DUF317 domain-containing protein [Streptomyces sp. NPDC057682]|uniref:DUF317 domain-containing protein n=1 Tax=Streptomyces sp. NPDC057682 TaxID=3346210 RepID=UPI0036931465
MLSSQQVTAFADELATQVPYDTGPRHLAGPGDARHVTHGLAAAGWDTVSDPLSPKVILVSPDRRHHLQFDPQPRSSARWRLRAESAHSKPGWHAEFGAHVPAEVLAGLTDALVARTHVRSPSPLSELDAAGWLIDGRGMAYTDNCTVERHSGQGPRTVPWDQQGPVAWYISVRDLPPDIGSSGTHLWHATFHRGTPEHLVAAFFTALVDTAPLQRGLVDPTATYGVTQDRSPLTAEQTADAYTRRIKAIRARARSAHRRQTHSATATVPPKPVPPARH